MAIYQYNLGCCKTFLKEVPHWIRISLRLEHGGILCYSLIFWHYLLDLHEQGWNPLFQANYCELLNIGMFLKGTWNCVYKLNCLLLNVWDLQNYVKKWNKNIKVPMADSVRILLEFLRSGFASISPLHAKNEKVYRSVSREI